MAASWIVAPALDELLRQLNEHAPRRSRASDGSIGDAAHASRDSDHNPWWTFDGQPYVTARDFTHDPAGGLDCEKLATALRLSRDQRIKYVIWNGHIMAGAGGPSPWAWRIYNGTNQHKHHLHLSVVPQAISLARIPWGLSGLDIEKEDDMSWTHAEGAPQIPDYYRSAPPGAALPDPVQALAWATAHAAHARDEAMAARADVAALSAKLDQLIAGLSAAGMAPASFEFTGVARPTRES